MNEIAVFDNIKMTSVEIAELVGSRHDKVKQSIERLAERRIIQLPPMGRVENKQSLSPNRFVNVYIFEGEQGKRDSIIVVAQLCPEFTARLVDRWRELEEQVRKPAALQAPVEAALAIAETAARMLNMCPSSKLLMLQNTCKEYNVPVGILPAYTTDGGESSRLTKSLTEILKENDVGISTRRANAILVEEGILEERTRPSSKGGVKKFKALTDLGLEFGKNVTSPQNQREVAPHYYVDMIDELLTVIKGEDEE